MWLDNINKMKKLSKKTLDEISVESGIPKGTLNKLFSGQTKDPQLSTMKAVVHCLGYTLDDLSLDNIESKRIEPDIIKKYNSLPLEKQKIIDEVIDCVFFKIQSKPKESE